jgi:hypothetical protein
MATPKAGLKTMPTNTLKNEQIFNEAMVLMEALLYRGAVSRSLTAPPGGSPQPANGTIYLLPEGSPTTTGDWSGQEGNLAVYYNGWRFIPPDEGLTVWIADELQLVQYRSGVWTNINEFPAQTLAELTDVDLTGSPSPANGDSLTFNGTAWVAGAGSSYSGVRVRKSTAQTLTTATHTVLTWDTEDWDDNGYRDPGNPTRLVAPVAGLYEVTLNAACAAVNVTMIFSAYIMKNAAGVGAFPGEAMSYGQVTSGVNSNKGTGVTVQLELAAGEYVEGFAIHTRGSNLDTDATATNMHMRLLRAT